MNIERIHSHLNGREHIIVHKPNLWQELEEVVGTIDAESCRTKVSKEKTRRGEILYSPVDLNQCFRDALAEHEWQESRTSYWVTTDAKLIRHTMEMDPEEQKREIEDAGETPIFSYNQTDFVKERLAVRYVIRSSILRGRTLQSHSPGTKHTRSTAGANRDHAIARHF